MAKRSRKDLLHRISALGEERKEDAPLIAVLKEVVAHLHETNPRRQSLDQAEYRGRAEGYVVGVTHGKLDGRAEVLDEIRQLLGVPSHDDVQRMIDKALDAPRDEPM